VTIGPEPSSGLVDLRRDAIAVGLLGAALLAPVACFPQHTRPPVDAAPVAVDAAPLAVDAAPVAADAAPVAAVDAARFDTAPDIATIRRPCAPPQDRDQPIPMLSATGCVDPQHPLRPAPDLLFYEVSSPLWSDGADKQRWVFVPPGKQVTVMDDDGGQFQFPDGAVLMKHFSIAGKRIETRLITRSAGGWGTYSYRWNDQQTEAVVVGSDEGAVAREVPGPNGSQIWTYPARSDCTKCHTDEAGFQLGLTLRQLNTTVTYPDGVALNQIDRWQAQGLFATPPALPYPAPLPLPTGAQGSLEQRARSYLHANCANCHRPDSQNALMDLRWTTAFADTDTCNALPSKGNLGVAGARRIVPGQPAQSLVSLRMHTLQERFRMPQIGTAVLDQQGAKVVDDWIASLPPTCPTR
jgi:uncharacterized repeat protein (TIGR03806 family)